ncbi:MAG: cytochrome c oxidase subunit 3 family protein [Bacteroidales bacterium]
MEHRDDIGAKLGMWVFIFTEILLFGGLFLVYAIMRSSYSTEFHQAAHHLNAFIGSINTIVLLLSSATVAMSITAVQKGNNKLAVFLLFVTLICAAVFMVNKYFEWGHKFHIGLYPGSDLMISLSHGQVMFFSLYFFMTGLHMFHLVVGGIILTIVMIKVQRGTINASRYVLLENGGLYWHLVDLIWIFLFPLLYLIT